MLVIVTSNHCIQFQEKLMIQTQENGEKLYFGPGFGPLDESSGHQRFFFQIWLCQSLDVMVSYHHGQYQKKLMI